MKQRKREKKEGMGKKSSGQGRLRVSLLILAGAAGLAVILLTRRVYAIRMNKEAVSMASAAASFIDADLLEPSQDGDADQNYRKLRQSLAYFENSSEKVGFVYLLAMADGKLYVAAESGAGGGLPAGGEFARPPRQAFAAFEGASPALSGVWSDSRGKWVSVYVPVKAWLSEEIAAVLAVDYPARAYYSYIFSHMLRAGAVVICIWALLALLVVSMKSRYRLKGLSVNLEQIENLFKTIFGQAPIGIALVDGFRFLVDMNAEYARILGRPREELSGMDWRDITHPEDLSEELSRFGRFKSGKIPGYSMEKRFLMPDGGYRWVNMTVAHLGFEAVNAGSGPHICMLQDIHERKVTAKALKESERSKEVLLENLPGMAYRRRYDRYFTMEFVSGGCRELTGYCPESLVGNRDIAFCDIIAPEYGEIIRRAWARALELRGSLHCEYEIITASGGRKWVLETGQGIFAEDGSVRALEGIIIDITESKLRQNQIEYINTHDFLTGLYNRKYYETEKRRLDEEGRPPLSVILADINGVRLVNDAFGHKEGDRLIVRAADILKSCCREGDLLARTGGDEFSILLPETDSEQACEVIKAIARACGQANAQISDPVRRVSLSVGYGTKTGSAGSLEAAEREAEAHLRRRKFFEQKSIKNEMLSSIMATLYARSQETEEHSRRISENCIKVAEKLGLSQSRQDDLHLTAMLHDIGKVGISDSILNKPGKLSDEEWKTMRTHPEIGYHLVMSVPELSAVADYILAHHERWDGSGYPLGLSGEDIPLLSRILAVADAYDAMLSNRAYRQAMSKEAAIEELIRNSGSQFDPKIAEIFIELMRDSA